MPSAFVKLNMSSRQVNYLRFQPADETMRLRNTASGFGIEVGMNLAPVQAVPEDQEEQDKKSFKGWKANGRYEVPIGILNPVRYNAMVSVNPELLKLAQVSCPTILEPGEELELSLIIQPFKNLSPEKIPWLVRIYLIS